MVCEIGDMDCSGLISKVYGSVILCNLEKFNFASNFIKILYKISFPFYEFVHLIYC